MSRFDWLAKFFRLRPRVKVKREKREPKPMRVWDVFPPWMKHLRAIEAMTKSEARAMAKNALGIGRQGRLPAGTVVQEQRK